MNNEVLNKKMPASSSVLKSHVSVCISQCVRDGYEYKMSPYGFIQHHYRTIAHTIFMFLAYANKHWHNLCSYKMLPLDWTICTETS